MSILNHSNIIKLYSTFQDKHKLYFILEYCPNRDLADLIRSQGKLSLELSKFYIAEIVSALEYMHGKGVYHRDLKPENIALDDKMHLKLLDFATANIKGMFFNKKTMKFEIIEKIEDLNLEDDINAELVGTPDYVSPEVLTRNKIKIGPAVDLWALGCILYLFLHGETPFKDKTDLLMFDKILNDVYVINDNIDPDAKDLINKLLIKDPDKRLGAGPLGSSNDFNSLKSHNFFKGIDWDKLKYMEAPIDITNISFSPLKSKGSTDDSLSPVIRCAKSSEIEMKNDSNSPINSSSTKLSFQDISPFKVIQCIMEDNAKDGLVLESNSFYNYRHLSKKISLVSL